MAKPTPTEQIKKHLIEKNRYQDEYIDRVISYMNRHPDLANEFATLLPKNTLLNNYILVKGTNIKKLGATTMLPRSAIYVTLARLREEKKKVDKIVDEEIEYFRNHRL